MKNIARRSVLVLFCVFVGLVSGRESAAQKVTTYVNVSDYAVGIWAVNQLVTLYGIVGTTGSTAGVTAAPTGTIQFLLNGQPFGSPVALNEHGQVFAAVPVAVPGSYVLTDSYSGDANYAASTSTYSDPFTVAYNPPTLQPIPSVSSLTIAAGATTGNSFSVTMEGENGCGCSADWNTDLTVDANTTVAGPVATLSLTNSTADSSGNIVYGVVIASTAPRTVTVGQRQSSAVAPLLALAGGLLILPFARGRSRGRLPAALLCFALMSGLSSCSTDTKVTQPTKTTVSYPGSAGQYTVTIHGYAATPSNGQSYFTRSVPVTIQ